MRKLILLFTAVFLLSAFSACSSDSDSSSDSPQAEPPADTTQEETSQEDGIAVSNAPEVRYFAVTFETFGGTDIAPQSVESGKTATKPTDPVVEGLIFAGWYTDSDCTSIFSFDEPITEHIILYAKWIDSSVPTFTVHFETEYGYVSNQIVESGKTATKPIDPTCYSYIFKGWYTDTDFTELFNFDEPITDDITLYAKWNKLVNVYFCSGMGSTVDNQTIESGKTATKPTDPTGYEFLGWYYVFAGWYTDIDCSEPFDFGSAVTADTYLYAKWNRLVNVFFYTSGGSTVESQTVESGKTATKPTDPTKEGYLFAGWYTDSDCSEPFDFGSAVLADTKLYAKWNMRLSVVVKDSGAFNNFLKNTLGASDMTAFKRASEAPSTAAVYYLDKDETDPLIPIWYDSSSKTVFYYIPDNVYKLKIESGYKMFYGCSSLTKLDLSGFDTGKVTDMSEMFSGCISLTKLDLSGFDTSKVTDMSDMFYDCSSLTELDVSRFYTVNVTDMSYMFYVCSSLTELDVSRFVTGNVTNMNGMFSGCSSLTELDVNVSGFYTGNVTNMGSMFSYCSSLTELDVSRFDTSNVTNMGSMFNGCSSLTDLNLSGGFDTSNVEYMNDMFSGCSSLIELDVSRFDTSNVKYMNFMFSGCCSLVTIYASPSADWNMSTVSGSALMFSDCKKLKGGNGTAYSSISITYAHVDTEGNPGYFTAKN